MVIEFTAAEDSSPIEIHRCLKRVYREDATDVSSVRRGSIASRAVKKALVTRPSEALPDAVTTTRPKTRLMC